METSAKEVTREGLAGAGPVSGRVRGRTVVLVAVTVAVHMALAWVAREPGILTREDDAEYVMLGQSLREGGYQETYRVGEPLHSQYPPVYPAMLALWGAVFGDGFDASTALSVLLSGAFLVLVFQLLRRELGENLALLAIATLAVNPLMVQFAGAVLSEVPYMVLTVLVLLLVRDGRGPAFAAGAVAVAAALTRSAGVTVVGALVLYWLLARRRRTALGFALVSGLVLGGWFLLTALAPEQFVGASYVADLGAPDSVEMVQPGFRRIFANIGWYAQVGVPWALAVPTIPGTPVDNAVGLLVLVATGIAGLVVMARRWRLGGIYLVVYGALLAWWVWHAERFVAPVLFLIVAATLAGAFSIGSGPGRRWGPVLAVGLAVALVAGGVWRSAALVAEHYGCGRVPDRLAKVSCVEPDQVSFFEAVRWVRAATPQDAVFLAAKGSPLWFYTGRQVVGYRPALARPPEEFLPYLREQGTDYILLGSLHFDEPAGLLDRVEANCSRLTVAAFFPARTWIFSLRPPSSPGEAEASCAAAAEYRNLNEGRNFESGT